jgi:hypothetical protein
MCLSGINPAIVPTPAATLKEVNLTVPDAGTIKPANLICDI